MPDRRRHARGHHDTPSEVVAAAIATRLHGQHLLLLTDFDGTLAELAPTPAAAFLAVDVQAQIAAVEALPMVTFGVVSGRRLVDVRHRVGDDVEFVAGLHGLEIDGPGADFRHPQLDAAVPVVQQIRREAERTLTWCPGVYFEDKTYALTCHVRLAPHELGRRMLKAFRVLAQPQTDAHVLRMMDGAEALELLPNVDWHKGRAVEWIRSRVAQRTPEPVSVVYLGDDTTDEDAFSALGDDDIAIGVGARPHARMIDWRLAGPSSVGRLLGHLVRLRSRPSHHE